MKITPKEHRKKLIFDFFECCYAEKLFMIAVLSLFINATIYLIQQFRGIDTGSYLHYFFVPHIFEGILGIDGYGILFSISKILFLVSLVLTIVLESIVRIYDMLNKN